MVGARRLDGEGFGFVAVSNVVGVRWRREILPFIGLDPMRFRLMVLPFSLLMRPRSLRSHSRSRVNLSLSVQLIVQAHGAYLES
jgi:hypothetical protein